MRGSKRVCRRRRGLIDVRSYSSMAIALRCYKDNLASRKGRFEGNGMLKGGEQWHLRYSNTLTRCREQEISIADARFL